MQYFGFPVRSASKAAQFTTLKTPTSVDLHGRYIHIPWFSKSDATFDVQYIWFYKHIRWSTHLASLTRTERDGCGNLLPSSAGVVDFQKTVCMQCQVSGPYVRCVSVHLRRDSAPYDTAKKKNLACWCDWKLCICEELWSRFLVFSQKLASNAKYWLSSLVSGHSNGTKSKSFSSRLW